MSDRPTPDQPGPEAEVGRSSVVAPDGVPAIPGLTDHAAFNRASWNADADDYQARHAAQLAADGGMTWGVWHIPESELHVLGEIDGRDIWSSAAAPLAGDRPGRGWRPAGRPRPVRPPARPCAPANDRGRPRLPLLHASAEDVPLPDRSFDIVFCDHGAMSFADPYRTVPEAARLLRLAVCWRSAIIGDPRPGVGRQRRACGNDPRPWTTSAAPPRVERGGRVPVAVRRMDPPVPGQRFRDPRSPRAAARARRDELLPRRRRARLVAPLAVGIDLASPSDCVILGAPARSGPIRPTRGARRRSRPVGRR